MIGQKKLKNVEYFSYFGSIITDITRCTRGIKYGIAVANTVFSRKKYFFTRKLSLNLRKFYFWSIILHAAEICTLQKVDEKYLETFQT
jgi:hypothetical protein